MSTVQANLDVDQYVKVNKGFNPMSLQAHRDAVRIVFSDSKPAKGNTTFHKLGGKDPIYQVPYVDTDVWALATTNRSSLTITEVPREFTSETNKTAYNDISAESLSPITQVKSRSGLLNNVLTVTDSGASGTNSVENNKFTCQTGIEAGGLASILTLRQLTTRAGQGSLSRFSAVFNTPIDQANQTAGLITAENAFTFGYIGLNFGIIIVRDGVDELQELTLTAPASTAETVTVTINDNTFPVLLTGGSTVEIDAFEISSNLNENVPNYNFSSNGAQVVSQAVLPGPNGAFSYTSPGTSVGTWEQISAGDIGTSEFIPQSDWNFDTRLEGNTNRILNPQTTNYYKIQLDGSVDFFVQDIDTKKDILVHRINFINEGTLSNPSEAIYRVGWFVRNTGNTTNVKLQGSFASCFIEGKIYYDNIPQGIATNQTVTSNSGQHSIVIIRNRLSFNGKVNRSEILPLLVSAASQTSKFAFFKMLINPIFASPVIFQYVDKDNSLLEISTQDIIITGGSGIGSATVEAGAPTPLEFNRTNNRTTTVYPGSTVVFVAEIPSSGGTADCQVNLTMQEDL